MNIKKMSDKKLISEAKELHQWLAGEEHNFDIDNEVLYEQLISELKRRGYETDVESELIVEKA